MAENGKPVDFAAPDETPIDLFSRDNAWYKKDIGDRIPDSGRKLLEEYSKIKPEDVDRHIYEMVYFLELLVPRFPIRVVDWT